MSYFEFLHVSLTISLYILGDKKKEKETTKSMHNENFRCNLTVTRSASWTWFSKLSHKHYVSGFWLTYVSLVEIYIHWKYICFSDYTNLSHLLYFLTKKIIKCFNVLENQQLTQCMRTNCQQHSFLCFKSSK